MIYITGDCHTDFLRFNKKIFTEQKEMTKDDYVIVCGDFGGVWAQGMESKEEKWRLDWLDSQKFTLLFVDGNHENFDRLYQYPVEEWHGGKVHKIRPSVIHLMRGQVFELDGRTIFTFGGASSHDIDGGILEVDDPNYKRKMKLLDYEGIPFRVNHLSWWEQELPSEEEMEEGLRNLERYGNQVDFIVSHCCATSTQDELVDLIDDDTYTSDRLTDYFERIKTQVQFKKWFFGHYHSNRNVSEKELLLYEQIIRVS